MVSTSKKTAKINTEYLSVDDSIVSGVMYLMGSTNEWTGTMTELGKHLENNGSLSLPGSPSALRVVLNRVVNRLRCRGVSVKFNRTKDSTRTRYVRFATR